MSLPLIAQPSGSTEFTSMDCIPTTIPYASNGFMFRAIRANEAGSLTYTSARGFARTVNFLAGETRHLCGSAVSAATGITNIEVMY